MKRKYQLIDDSVVVVIGSGAGGGTLANELAQKGIDVVCLEAGARLGFEDIENDPPLMEQRMGWNDKRLGNNVFLCKTVGGTTMRFTAIAARLADFEFKALSTYGKMEDTSLIDWPITLQDLEPYYDKAEDNMGVSGTHGTPPSFKHSNYKVMEHMAKKVGYKHVTNSGMAINSVARDGRPPCMQIGFCLTGCKIGAKWSTMYSEIPKAEATGNFELRTEVMVTKINHNKAGKVTGVVYVDKNGVKHEQSARAVAVAGNAVETARLLLNSASSQYPDGLGNASGHVGRNYMRHAMSIGFSVMPKPVYFYRGAQQTGHIEDERFHDAKRGFSGGYFIETGAGDPRLFSAFIPEWGEKIAKIMDKYDHFAGLAVSGEDPPQLSNRITLHPTERDQHGLPVPVIKYDMHPNTVKMQQHGNQKMDELFATVGGTNTVKTTGSPFGTHNMGVARMSADPKDGVTNKWGQVHDIPNLFVSDGSLFSTSGAANPTLTIVALAIRQAEHIASRVRRQEL